MPNTIHRGYKISKTKNICSEFRSRSSYNTMWQILKYVQAPKRSYYDRAPKDKFIEHDLIMGEIPHRRG